MSDDNCYGGAPIRSIQQEVTGMTQLMTTLARTATIGLPFGTPPLTHGACISTLAISIFTSVAVGTVVPFAQLVQIRYSSRR